VFRAEWYKLTFGPASITRVIAGSRRVHARPSIPDTLGGVVLPNLSVLWVIAFVLFLTVVLDRLLFRPISRVKEQRERSIESAEALAETATARAEAAAAEFDAKTTAARAELYRQMDDMRREATRRRVETVAATRQEAEAAIAEAGARVKAESDEARARLRHEADALGAAVAERILGAKVS
jgi:F-type H+-transporting ATPase subunit b